MLTVAQVLTISYVLSSVSSRNRSEQLEKLCFFLSNALHRVNLVEFKARHLLEYWMEWENSVELSSFAYHAALLLINSDLWLIKATTIVCDLLCCEDDRFRQRTEIILGSKANDNDIRTSSKLGLDVLLTLATKEAHYSHSSSFASLILGRMFENITLDVISHLEVLLWLERYRIHALKNKEYVLNNSGQSSFSPIASYFPTDTIIEVSFCENICRMSNDLVAYMCDLIKSNFSLFLPIEGDTTSNAVLESHSQFVVSVLIYLTGFFGYINETRILVINALIILFETSKNDQICQAVAYAFGDICDTKTSDILFDKLQRMVNNDIDNPPNYSDSVLATLISSYCHCASVCSFNFDQEAINLFHKLLKYSSQDVLKAIHVGLGRVLKNSSLLFQMLDSDYIQCYHALIGSTAYTFLYNTLERSTETTAEFIEQHPDLLSIFIFQLYNRIRHFNDHVQHIRTMDFYLLYGYPQYVRVAELIAIRIPATFSAFIKDWCEGENFKRALFYTSKQHNYLQRAACLTILSIFGELTTELCQMIIEALRDDPHIQNTCYKCLTRINSIKDEQVVLNLLFSYLKSKSMTVRYATVKILLHLSQSALISSGQVRTVLYDLMLDPSSNENLWLIQEQDNIRAECMYYYAGPLKDVIYSLLIQHLTGDASVIIRRDEFNDIDADFIESKKAARLASCLYEEKTVENLQLTKPAQMKSVD